MLKYVKETYVSNHFIIIIIWCSFLYKLATYHWKGLNKIYSFVVENILINIYMQK
jgi:hypothetical protein